MDQGGRVTVISEGVMYLRAHTLSDQAYVVQDVQRKKNETVVHLHNGSRLKLPPFAYVHVRDQVEVQTRDDEITSVHKRAVFAPEGTTPHVQLFPPYAVQETIDLPPHVLNITF